MLKNSTLLFLHTFVPASSCSSYSTKNRVSGELFSHCFLGSLHPRLSSVPSKQKKNYESVYYPDCSCYVGLSIAYIITRCERPAPVFKTLKSWASQVALVVKNLPANAGDIRDSGWIPGLGRFPAEGHSNPLKY